MPKDRRTSSFRRGASPYSCGTENADDFTLENRLQSVGDEKEWEEARCPICMEHPHSAVLLLCTSKGCRPYVCNTSSLHSNCLDQYLNSSAANPSANTTDEVHSTGSGVLGGDTHQEPRELPVGCGQPNPKYLCPLCRGEFTEWVVVEPARKFMNGKKRSCSLETCDFSGTYPELRNHTRRVHPSQRPSETEPERVQEWTRLERERDLQDMLVHHQDGHGGGNEIVAELTETFVVMAGRELTTLHQVEVRYSIGVAETSFDDPDEFHPSDEDEDDLGMDTGIEVGMELLSMTFGFLPPSGVPTTPHRRRNASGQSGGGRTTARMSVRDNSGHQLASRGGEEERDFSWGRTSRRGQQPPRRD